MNLSLAINTGFAVNRYAEPEEWIRILGGELGVGKAQFTADMLNPDLPAPVIASQARRIEAACQRYGVTITSTFTGAFTRVNHLAHPDPEVRAHWIGWFKRFAELSVDLGARAMGSHFGIFTLRDNKDLTRRAERRAQNIDAWHRIGEYARGRGLEFLSWEPMSISREQGETIPAARKLQEDVNRNAPIAFKMCLDVDHGDLSSSDPDDTDPHAWLRAFPGDAPQIHLKQSSADKRSHWPFTAEHNERGRIRPDKVVGTLREAGYGETELILELSFREREPTDGTVIEALKESVAYWRGVVPD